jgi:hypothetical protein
MKPSSRAIEFAWAARNALDRRDEPGAFAAAAQALSHGDTSPDILDTFHILAGTLDADLVSDILGRELDKALGYWPPVLHAEVAATHFDRLLETSHDDARLAAAAVEALEAAAGNERNEAGWRHLEDPDRRAAILAAAGSDPDAIADALEHLAFAPRHAGLQADAARFAEQAAYAHGTNRAVVRAAEVLLYAIARDGGPEATAARDAARRLEAMRKTVSGTTTRTPAPAPRIAPDISGAIIVLVGGHDGLRAAIRTSLAPRNPRELRDLPPTWEGQLGGGPESAIRGADLAVLIIRQLDHSTGDAAEAAAREFGIPLRRARSASTAAIIATIDDWALSRAGR